MKKPGKYDKIIVIGIAAIAIGMFLTNISKYFQILSWIGIILIVFVAYKKWGNND